MLRENTEAVVAACDAAQGRWAKLLGVRALLHPKLRLQEFLSIYNITQEFITATEKVLIFLILFSLLFVSSSICFFFSFIIKQCLCLQSHFVPTYSDRGKAGI